MNHASTAAYGATMRTQVIRTWVGQLPVAQVRDHLRIQRMVSSTFPVIRFNNPFAPTSSFHPGSQLFGKLLLIHDSSHGLESF
jgi:hypothetical protein